MIRLPLAFLAALAFSLTATAANPIPADANLSWQFTHSTDVAQVEVVRAATEKARGCEMVVWDVKPLRIFKGTLRAGEITRVWGPDDPSEWPAGSERLMFLRHFEGKAYDTCSARVFARYRQVHWGCCDIRGAGDDAQVLFGTLIDSEQEGPAIPVQAGTVYAALQALADDAAAQSNAPLLSIATLLAEPAAHDARWVRVRGAAVVRVEATFLCPSAEAIAAGDQKQCLALVPGETGDPPHAFDLRPLHGKVVELTGRFDAKRFGHMGAYGVTLAVVSSELLGKHDQGDVPLPAPEPPR